MEANSKFNDEYIGGVQDTLWGCLLCLLANFMFAFCDVIAGKVSKSYDNKVMGSLYYQIFQGLYQLPVFIWVWWWPLTPTTENKESDWSMIYWSWLPALALSFNNASVFIGVTIKSPFYVNIGTLLGIPLAFVVDIFIHHYKPTIMPMVGAILLIISFLMLEVIQPPKQMRLCHKAFINGGEDEDEEDVKNVDENEKEELLSQPLIVNDGSLSKLKMALPDSLQSIT